MKNKYEVNNGVAHIEVVKRNGERFEVLMSESDFERFVTEVDRSLWISNTGYAGFTKDKVNVLLHRWIVSAPDNKLVVDHINQNRQDNTRDNLRVVTRNINTFNTDKVSSKLGVKNVYMFRGKYKVTFKVNNKSLHFGTYETIEEAKEVAEKVRGELYDTV